MSDGLCVCSLVYGDPCCVVTCVCVPTSNKICVHARPPGPAFLPRGRGELALCTLVARLQVERSAAASTLAQTLSSVRPNLGEPHGPAILAQTTRPPSSPPGDRGVARNTPTKVTTAKTKLMFSGQTSDGLMGSIVRGQDSAIATTPRRVQLQSRPRRRHGPSRAKRSR